MQFTSSSEAKFQLHHSNIEIRFTCIDHIDHIKFPSSSQVKVQLHHEVSSPSNIFYDLGWAVLAALTATHALSPGDRALLVASLVLSAAILTLSAYDAVLLMYA